MYRLGANGLMGGFGASCLHGDLGSSSDASTKAETTNNQIGQQGAPNSREFAISGSNITGPVTVTDADPEVSKKGLDLAAQVANESTANVSYALQTVQYVQGLATAAVSKAQEEANQVALTATPVSPGAYLEATGKNNLILVGGIAALLFVFKLAKK